MKTCGDNVVAFPEGYSRVTVICRDAVVSKPVMPSGCANGRTHAVGTDVAARLLGAIDPGYRLLRASRGRETGRRRGGRQDFAGDGARADGVGGVRVRCCAHAVEIASGRMLKAMMFIDGSWFDFNVKKLLPRKTFIEQIRFEPIWDAVRAHAKAALGFEVDLVRCYCVAGHPDPMTVGQRSIDYANRIVDGWEQLRRLPCMSVDLYPYDYGGNEFPRMEGAGESGGRIAKEKRDPRMGISLLKARPQQVGKGKGQNPSNAKI